MTDNKLILNLFAKALGNEKFLNIDKVENNGKTVYGNFKAGQWGTFRVFLSFTKNATGKFERLDINWSGKLISEYSIEYIQYCMSVFFLNSS